ncbi:MAG: ATP-binding cassette domain-containing protein [Caldilinea sp. CFX5]|nr:ATP-binding cassette domain-containing protein [Caldilinea sp. CFX5]
MSVITRQPIDTANTPAAPATQPAIPQLTIPQLTIPQLIGRWPHGLDFAAPIDQPNFVIGRSLDADLVAPQSAPFVSSRHLEIQTTPAGYAVVDLHSTNGARLNNRLLRPGEATPLKHGDILRIGAEQSGASVGFTFLDPTTRAADQAGFQTLVSTTGLTQIERVTIGRDPDNDIVLTAPTVARRHALIQKYDADHHLIKALDGQRITVNGEGVMQAHLQRGDQVQIGPHLLTYDGVALVQYDSQGYRLDVVDLHKSVKTKAGATPILDSISLTILPREFVALVGGSGAGKSTLLDALNGFRPAQGKVLVNGRDLYAHYDEFRTQMGYVPQQEILPTTLTVEAALHYAAELRLAPDISAHERAERITQALEAVEMNSDRIRQTRISQLSGGQRKRVSIAAELLADPKIFFLDEPASGLDPGLEKKLMYTLRKLADEGRTIILITHATDNITQVDNVAFLAQGQLIYYGPPAAAQSYFEVDTFADIYEKIEKAGDQWRRIFTQEKPAAYQQYVVQRQATMPTHKSAQHTAPGPVARFGQGWRQIGILSRRMIRLTLTDWVALFVSLLVMPFVAGQQLLVASSYALTGDPAILGDGSSAALAQAAARLTQNYLPALDAHTFLFGVAMLAFLVGAFGGSQELIKERSIYLRERMINLGLLPYLTSKFLVFAGFGALQIALYILVLYLGMAMPTDGRFLPGPVELGVTLFLTLLTGTATGLLISSLAPNSTVAMYLVLIVVFFQNLFGGAVHDLRHKPIEAQSYIAATRWSALALGTTLDINKLAAATIVCGNKVDVDTAGLTFDPATGQLNLSALRFVETDEPACTNRAMKPDELFLPYGDTEEDLWRFWGYQLALGACFALATVLAVKRLDWK